MPADRGTAGGPSSPQYVIRDDGSRPSDGGPLNDEYHGPHWQICGRIGEQGLRPVVLVPDQGDGSALTLAEGRLHLLNSGRPFGQGR
jgi:hypothetical protein